MHEILKYSALTEIQVERQCELGEEGRLAVPAVRGKSSKRAGKCPDPALDEHPAGQRRGGTENGGHGSPR